MKFVGSPNIDIRLNNGVYFFNGYAATGKSYLADELSSLVPDNDSIFVGTYLNGKYIDFGDKNKASILVYDRLDKYFSNNIANFIANRSKYAIVLVDLKNLNLMTKYLVGTNYDIVDIDFSKDKIVVGDL